MTGNLPSDTVHPDLAMYVLLRRGGCPMSGAQPVTATTWANTTVRIAV